MEATGTKVTINAERLAQINALLRVKRAPQANGCVLWTGYIQPNGYGYINTGGLQIPAHRAALISSGVDVPIGMDVCHRCDVRACIEPTHLYVGTRKQNMADCTSRGRHNKPVGDRHWCAKLTGEQVVAARVSHINGESQSSIARRLGVHPATISRIARGVWRTEVSL